MHIELTTLYLLTTSEPEGLVALRKMQKSC